MHTCLALDHAGAGLDLSREGMPSVALLDFEHHPQDDPQLSNSTMIALRVCNLLLSMQNSPPSCALRCDGEEAPQRMLVALDQA